MKIVITGASGFIGSYITYHLANAGHQIVALVRDPNKLPWLQSQSNIKVVVADLSQPERLDAIVHGQDACIHTALIRSNEPLAMLQADTRATVALLSACAEAGVGRFLYTSSIAAVGKYALNMDERIKTSPIDWYGATKAASEAYVLAMAASSSMRCNIIRPGYTFGNPVIAGAGIQPDDRFLRITRAACCDKEVQVKSGSGAQFIWAGDLVKVYESLLTCQHNRQVYFALSRTFVSWADVAEQFIGLSGSKSRVVLQGKPRAAREFDVSKMDAHFGLKFDAQPHLHDHLLYYLNEHKHD